MARDGKIGAGEVSGWIVEVLQRGPATRAELRMGSSFSRKQIDNAMVRLHAIGAVRPYVNPETGRVAYGQAARYKSRQFELVPGRKVAPVIVYPASARTHRVRQRINPVRHLQEAFRAIVGERAAQA